MNNQWKMFLNRVYRNFRTGPDNFPILFGFDASGARITSKSISCSESSVARKFERNFHFRSFWIFHRWSIGGPPVGKPPRNLSFPHRWPPVVHRWPVVGYHGLSVRAANGLFGRISQETNIILVRSFKETHFWNIMQGKELLEKQGINLRQGSCKILLRNLWKKHYLARLLKILAWSLQGTYYFHFQIRNWTNLSVKRKRKTYRFFSRNFKRIRLQFSDIFRLSKTLFLAWKSIFFSLNDFRNWFSTKVNRFSISTMIVRDLRWNLYHFTYQVPY